MEVLLKRGVTVQRSSGLRFSTGGGGGRYTVTPLLGEPPICNTLSSTTLFSMTDWFSLYKTYKLTSNEQHLSNPTCNTQTVNKHSQHPLLSNTFPGFPVAPFQHHSMWAPGFQRCYQFCPGEINIFAPIMQVLPILSLIFKGDSFGTTYTENALFITHLYLEQPQINNLRWATPSFEQHFFFANGGVAQKRCYCIFFNINTTIKLA